MITIILTIMLQYTTTKAKQIIKIDYVTNTAKHKNIHIRATGNFPFPNGNSRESAIPRIPTGITEFLAGIAGNLKKICSVF